MASQNRLRGYPSGADPAVFPGDEKLRHVAVRGADPKGQAVEQRKAGRAMTCNSASGPAIAKLGEGAGHIPGEIRRLDAGLPDFEIHDVLDPGVEI
jgi:hypothetical protein